jgi:Dyp-type peroxidase family
MTLDLHRQADSVDISNSDYHDLLKNLQANILKPHGRNFARLLMVQFTAPPANATTWIRDVLTPKLTTARVQYDTSAARRADPSVDGGTVYGFFMSAKGYKFLGRSISGFESAYQKGMKDRDSSLFSKVFEVNDKDPKPSTWEVGYQEEIHALITLADDDLGRLIQVLSDVESTLTTVGTVVTREEGITLRWKTSGGKPGAPIEHFGYVDGVSNPVFTHHDLVGANRIGEPYSSAPMAQILVDDPLSNVPDSYGTYFVFRKLRQNVLLFEAQIKQLAQDVGVDEHIAGAMVVGRFKDGTPLTRANTPAGLEALIPNDFDYTDDENGSKCPLHAHIRKLNPRAGTLLRSHEKNDGVRIARRGIPYGKPVPNLVDDSVETDVDTTADRGLLFMCCQASIKDQFEFLQHSWADNPNFPKSIIPLLPDTGDDPLIGQDAGEPQHWPKVWGNHDAGRKKFNFESPVTLRGGEYFFAPSLPFLRTM